MHVHRKIILAMGLILSLGPSGVLAQAPVADAPGEFQGQEALDVLHAICKLGPRISGSAAMQRQQEMLTEHFTNLGATVTRQAFSARHPATGATTELANLIVSFHPDRPHRVLIACHYDTRPYPDRDPRNPYGTFHGANDGASGVGLFWELGRHVTEDIEPGVDLVFFDAEEWVYDARRDPLFVGSTHFARQYAEHPPTHRYHAGVLVDLVGDAHLDLYWERNSLKYARDLTQQIWEVAADLNVPQFVPRARHEIRDDHLPLNEIAKIPTCNIIDFDYPTPSSKNAYWHTEQDTPDKCSAESLAAVGCVLVEWLKRVEIQP